MIKSTELILVSTVALVGLIAGFASVRDSVISEISDLSGSLQDVNNDYNFSGLSSGTSSTAGSDFVDALDVADSPDDTAGSIDNFISFIGPVDEGETIVLTNFGRSEVALIRGFSNQTTTSVEGTIGDSLNNTTFTYSTDTGEILSTNDANGEVRISEANSDQGTFTIAFDDPVTDLEFWVEDFLNLDASFPENLIGNFTLTLSDGTVINNAAFTIIDDAIQPITDFGLFRTGFRDVDLVSKVTRSGLDYLTDPTVNGVPNQSAGRITFDDAPVYPSGGTVTNAVGISSFSFDRIGGSFDAEVRTNFSASVLFEQ